MVDTVRVKIGPVAAATTIAWTENTRKIVAAVRTNREKMPFAVPLDVLEQFEGLLDDWTRTAERMDPFLWEGDEETPRVRLLVQYWVNLDALSDDDLTRMGVAKSGPEAAPFFDALVEGVVAALETETDTTDYALNVKRALRSAR